MIKKISKILIILLLVQVLNPIFLDVFATHDSQTCKEPVAVCSATPNSFSLYLDFQNEVLALLQKNPFKTTMESVEESKGGLFTNKLLELQLVGDFDQSLLGKLIKNSYVATSRSTAMFLTASVLFIFSGLGTLADNSIGFSIFFHDRPIIRDWVKLLDVEWGINQVVYSIGKEGEIMGRLVETELLNQIFLKYRAKHLFDASSSFSGKFTYYDFAIALIRLNLAMKFFIAYDSTSFLQDFDSYGVKLDKERIKQLDDDYRCVRWKFGFKCNTSWSALVKNLDILLHSTEDQGVSSYKQIKHSLSELLQALELSPHGVVNNIVGKSSDAYLTEREKSLLRDIYGLDTTKMTKDKALSILSFDAKTKQQGKSFVEISRLGWNNYIKPSYHAISQLTTKEGWESLGLTLGKWGSATSKYIESLASAVAYHTKKVLKRAKSISTRAPKDILSELKQENQIYSPQADLLNLQMIAHLKALSISRIQAETLANSMDNSVMTTQFGELSIGIKKLIDTIGNKETNLRNTLNRICVYQCSNKGVDRCYIK